MITTVKEWDGEIFGLELKPENEHEKLSLNKLITKSINIKDKKVYNDSVHLYFADLVLKGS